MTKSRVIIALDFKNKADVLEFLDKFDEPLFVKVGMELFYGEGPAIIQAIKERGHSIFLDLKLHDIPHTVKMAMKNLARLDVDIVNVHASGSKAMMQAAIEGLEEEKGKDRPLCIAVTCLTSLSQEVLDDELGIHDAVGEDFLTVTPGIRLASDAKDDQKRVTTPAMAKNMTSSYIVVGRTITKAADPVAAYKEVFNQFQGE